MWIKASDRKPDSSRKVFVREGDNIALAAWLDFDQRWSNFLGWDEAMMGEPDYWMEISDLLALPIESKIDVHVEHAEDYPKFKVGQRVACRYNINIEGTIKILAYTEYDEFHNRVVNTYEVDLGYRTMYLDEPELELLEEHEENQPKFKVGQRVVVRKINN